ncbi:MAG TPA: metallophosphoesterase family protein [Thermoleophilaceae bacterium]|jgi:Icc-related predicted phosphoesterase
MRVLAFSDLHRDRERAASLVRRSEGVDVVIGAGDFASVHRGLEPTIEALAAIDTPTLVVPGNNETDEALRAACEDWPAATVLHGDSAELDGRSFFGLGAGVPVTPWDWSFDLSDEAAEGMLDDCPEGAVMVLHSPPRGHLDKGLGSEAILHAIEDKHPPLAVFGHIHECWGGESAIGDTQLLNLGPDGTVIEI